MQFLLGLSILLVITLIAAGCGGESPSGPSTLVNGNNNDVVIGGSGEDSRVGNVTRPAPVVVTPVVVTPPGAEEVEG